jgi:hypothetical protein
LLWLRESKFTFVMMSSVSFTPALSSLDIMTEHPGGSDDGTKLELIREGMWTRVEK